MTFVARATSASKPPDTTISGAVQVTPSELRREGDIDAARALVQEVEDAELFLYPGDRHLFTDPSLSTGDAQAAARVRERLKDFLVRLDA